MAALTYKCPNCGGGMVFDPEKQNYACEYCLSEFSQEELEALTPDAQEEEKEEIFEQAEKGEAVVYTCPSCGAEIATDETTAATFCYYCHNPVVLSGKLSGEQMPALVVPFKITQEQAKDRFVSWIGKKKYVPSAFFSKKQIEMLSGIYFPYWTYDCTMQGGLNGTARDLRVWRTGDMEYTETKVFSIRRAGQISLHDISRNALKKSQGKMMEGILPFDLSEAKDFHTGYLSGFQAEVKDLEKESFESDIAAEVSGYAKNLLAGTVTSHGNFTVDNFHSDIQKRIWHYVLLPVWILTYRSGKDMYYFAMNGQTGEICGKLPIDTKKLGVTCAGIFAVVTALVTLIGGLIL